MRRYLILAVSAFLAAETGAQVVSPAAKAASEARAGFGASELAEPSVPAIGRPVVVATAARGSGGEEELRKAKAQLEKTVERLKAMIARETDRDRKLELYDSLQETQAALDAVNQALASMTDGSSAKAQEAIDEALVLQRLLGSYLGTADFSSTNHLRQGPIEVQIGADVAYEALRRRLPFLGGAVGGSIRINPGAALVSQFNALKAEYYGSLLKATSLVTAEKQKQLLRSLTKWGHETRVIYPGQTWMQAEDIISWKQHNDLLDSLRN